MLICKRKAKLGLTDKMRNSNYMNMRNVEWEKEAKLRKKLKTSVLQDSVNKPYF